MEAKLPPRLGVVILMLIAVTFGANHISARIAFDHGASVVTGVFARSLFTSLAVFALLRLQGVPIALSRVQLWRAALIGVAGCEVPLTIVRTGARINLRLRSADRADFLKKPSLH